MHKGGLLVGEILKKRREELGQDLREISNILRIKHDYLRAIEEGAFEKLPEPVYVKGYIREYADHLQIDPEIALNAYVQQVSPKENREIPEQEIVPKKSFKTRYIVIPSLFAVFVIVMVFVISSFTTKEKWDTRTSSETERKLTPPPVETNTRMPSVVTQNETSPTPVEMPKELPPVAQTNKDTLPAEKSPHTLEIKATDTTWFSVKIDENSHKEIMINPGESVKFQAKKGFSLIIGNAGGVKMFFDGKEIRRLGEKGDVVKVNLPDAKI